MVFGSGTKSSQCACIADRMEGAETPEEGMVSQVKYTGILFLSEVGYSAAAPFPGVYIYWKVYILGCP